MLKVRKRGRQVENTVVINRKYEKGNVNAMDLFARLIASNIINSGQKQPIENDEYNVYKQVPKESY